nr:MAG TPA: hypothetical protein [Caudoviricetes sp.]
MVLNNILYIALPSHCQPVAGFLISGFRNHHRHAFLLNRPDGLTLFKHTAPANYAR